MNFPTKYEDIISSMDSIDAVGYGKSRNFIDGAVTYLSPYISRGVLSTKTVMEHVLNQDQPFWKVEKFIQELAWRDYWQQVWVAKGDDINRDLKRPQPRVENHLIPSALVNGETGIEAIDNSIQEFYRTGYLHNHVRMYIAAIACNIGKSHWNSPAKWMYYHLLDGDWASNALSWQWVAGANSNKTYVANQENINKYCHSNQRNTFLDVPYAAFENMSIPEELRETVDLELTTAIPKKESIQLDPDKPLLIYNYYNLDPNWRKEVDANRVLLLEPDHFKAYPIGPNAFDFMLRLGENIPGLQVYVGSFVDLQNQANGNTIYFKEHPLNLHYDGIEDSRDWMFSVKGYFPSFFAFWKKCKKELTS